VIRQISLHPDYHCRNLDAELIDFVKIMALIWELAAERPPIFRRDSLVHKS
jgi:hypothetical protein